MITLYGMEGAASAAPMMLLEQAGAAYEYVAVVRDDAGNHLEPEGYLDLHPFGQVPTLVDGDLILIQSAACSLHLCERFPELGLLPDVGDPDRARTYQYLIFLTNTVQEEYLRAFYTDRYTTDPDGAPGVLAAALAALRVACDYLADEIGAGPYLLGDRLTVADVYLAMLATWANGLDASEHWSRRPEMARHYAAVAAHPGFAKALAANGAGPTL
jgi:glutathione S-transferase